MFLVCRAEQLNAPVINLAGSLTARGALVVSDLTTVGDGAFVLLAGHHGDPDDTPDGCKTWTRHVGSMLPLSCQRTRRRIGSGQGQMPRPT
jgi:hypothetical protein